MDASEDGIGRGTPLVPIMAGTLAPSHFRARITDRCDGRRVPTLRAMGHNESHPNAGGQIAIIAPAVIFESRYARNGRGRPDVLCPPLKAQSGIRGAEILVQISSSVFVIGEDQNLLAAKIAGKELLRRCSLGHLAGIPPSLQEVAMKIAYAGCGKVAAIPMCDETQLLIQVEQVVVYWSCREQDHLLPASIFPSSAVRSENKGPAGSRVMELCSDRHSRCPRLRRRHCSSQTWRKRGHNSRSFNKPCAKGLGETRKGHGNSPAPAGQTGTQTVRRASEAFYLNPSQPATAVAIMISSTRLVMATYFQSRSTANA